MSQDSVTEPEHPTRVARQTDVLVAGGGIAGCFAAVAAARNGADVMLVDRFGSLGGNMGPGLIQGGSLAYFKSVKNGPPPLVTEFLDRISSLRGPAAANNAREANVASYVAARMLEDAGVEPMLSAWNSDPIVENGVARGLFIENKSGRRAILARAIIDATGEADVAARAGAPMLRPTDPTPDSVLRAIQRLKPLFPNWSGAEDARFLGTPSMGFGFQVAGVEWKRVEEFEARGGTCGFETEPNPYSRTQQIEGVGQVTFHVRAGRRLDSGIFEMRLEVKGPLQPGNGDHIGRLEFHSRIYLFEAIEQIRSRVVGFEDAYLLQTAPFLGSRGGTCIDGEYALTAEDMAEARRFDDVIYTAVLVDDEGKEIGPQCDVPYRVLLPKKLDGLIAVGRSASHRRLLRTRPNAMCLGIAGGTAAALAVATDTTPHTVDVRSLQRQLLRQGFYLGDADRLSHLGLA